MRLQVHHADAFKDGDERILDHIGRAHQFLDHRRAAEGRIGGGISPFVQDQQPPLAMPLGGAFDLSRHLAECRRIGHVAPQRVQRTAVKAGQHHDQFGPETIQGRDHHGFEGMHIRAMPGPRMQWDVQVIPLACPAAVFVDRTGIGGVIMVLMHRDRQRRRVIVIDALRPVAVMDVPIDKGHAPDAEFAPQRLDRDGAIGQQTESAPAIGFGVMPRRAVQDIGIVDLAPHHGAARCQAAACRQCRDLVPAGAEGGQFARIAAVLGALRLDAVDIGGVMDGKDFLIGRGGDIADAVQTIQDAADL